MKQPDRDMMDYLVQAIQRHVDNTPEAMAVSAQNLSLTYMQLNVRADDIANELHKIGIGRGDVVSIFAERSVELIVSMVGVLKTGAAYHILEKPEAVLTADTSFFSKAAIELSHDGKMQCSINKHWTDSYEKKSAFLAYVVATSGSTGARKLVGISHHNIQHYTESVLKRLGRSGAINAAHVSGFEADLGNTSVFLSLCTGGLLYVASDMERKDPSLLFSKLSENGVDLLKLTPTHWQAILPIFERVSRGEALLKDLLLGGELFSLELAERTLSSGISERLWNHYGPCETTVGIGMYEVKGVEGLKKDGFISVPIGYSVGENITTIEDQDGNRILRGVGELAVSGPSVSQGYLSISASSRDGFYQNGDGSFIYKTGDQVDVREDGLMEFIGRRDRQVKLSGFRVNLNELEITIKQVLGIEKVACWISDQSNRTRLFMAYHQDTAGLSDIEIKNKLVASFPPMHQPSSIHRVDKWPATENGKLDYSYFQTFEVFDDVERSNPASLDLFEAVEKVVCKQLGVNKISVDQSFFDAGGDSLDAISVIGSLQLLGLEVSTQAFLSNPTLAYLQELTTTSRIKQPSEKNIEILPAFRAVNDWWSGGQIKTPSHHNQSFLFETDAALEFEKVFRASRVLATQYPLLSAQLNLDKMSFRLTDLGGPMICFAKYTKEDSSPISLVIQKICEKMQKFISLEDGHTFAICCIYNAEGPNQLLMIAHHCIVDVISWRLIIRHFFQAYNEDRWVLTRNEDKLHELSRWLEEQDVHEDGLRDNVQKYLEDLTAPSLQTEETTLKVLEKDAKSAWIRFSSRNTKLLQAFAKDKGVHLSNVIMAACYKVIAEKFNLPRLVIDIEGHGRLNENISVDVSSAVGWFTGTFPLCIESQKHDLDLIRYVSELIDSLPTFIKSSGVELSHYQQSGLEPAWCYNYVGHFAAPIIDGKKSTFSTIHPGEMRGPDNIRRHTNVITSRILKDALSIDITFDSKQLSENLAKDFCEALFDVLSEWAKLEAVTNKDVLVTKNASGLLAFSPHAETEFTSLKAYTPYRKVLLTGATGFLGIHILKELSQRDDLEVTCLVRPQGFESAEERLRDIFNWHHPDDDWSRVKGRVKVQEGDLTQKLFGLSESAYILLGQTIQAIYHSAADVRLFATPEELFPINVKATENLIDFAEKFGNIDLHHLSTLSIAGVSSIEVFDEFAMDVGQSFRNSYEETKFRAERLLQIYSDRGGNVSVYRAGNVSGHSETGRFQKNAQENRLIQLLNALIQVRAVPDSERTQIALSPVDIVASGVVELSFISGLRGTFHVENPHAFSKQMIFDALSHVYPNSFKFSQAGSDTRDVFENVHNDDKTIALGKYWANRVPLSGRLDSSFTNGLLNENGVYFQPVTKPWLVKLLSELRDQGALTDITKETLT